jgi:hypothetical protein
MPSKSYSIPAEMMVKVKSHAEDNGMSESAVIQQAVDEFLNE